MPATEFPNELIADETRSPATLPSVGRTEIAARRSNGVIIKLLMVEPMRRLSPHRGVRSVATKKGSPDA
jgi:hypothetical protein